MLGPIVNPWLHLGFPPGFPTGSGARLPGQCFGLSPAWGGREPQEWTGAEIIGCRILVFHHSKGKCREVKNFALHPWGFKTAFSRVSRRGHSGFYTLLLFQRISVRSVVWIYWPDYDMKPPWTEEPWLRDPDFWYSATLKKQACSAQVRFQGPARRP